VIFKTVITAAMLIVGTLLMVNQQLTIGQFIAAEIVILLVLNSVEKLIINLGSVYDTLTAVEKASEITDRPVEKGGTVSLRAENNGVKFQMKDVSFSYNNETEILKNISLTIKPNEKICIQGKDSSGKSTLLKLMTGSYTDFKGSVMIDDVPIGNYNLDSLRSLTGVLLNQQDIFQGTLWENIALGNPEVSLDIVKECATKVGLNDFIATLKDGYDTPLDPTGKRLPRNVINRILLVRALASKPRLLLLEEPWVNSNNNHRQQIMSFLNELKNTTLVVVSNDEEFAKQCDRVIIMDENGTIKN
jgi:ABC-type bacteriocin/lantibiotic exporter with double-glycine peptidase domain